MDFLKIMWLKNLGEQDPQRNQNLTGLKKPWANIITGKNEKEKKKQRKIVLMSEKHEADEF